MEQQREIHDIIKVMEKYNFQKPINVSVIIEDHDKEPNRSKVSDYEENPLMTTSLQEKFQYLNYTIQQQHSCITKKPMSSCEIIPSQRYSGKGYKRNHQSECCRRPSNNEVNTIPHAENVISNTYLKEKPSCLYHSQKNETDLTNRVAKILASTMEAYVHYCTLIYKSEDQQCISQLKAECLRVKLNLFHKCLVISKDFLLQHQNNFKFIEKLLYKSQQFSKVKLPNKHFANLYGDLLKWIRFKKCETTKNYQNKGRNEHFFANTVQKPSNFASNPTIENRPATNIFTSGPPGNQVTISVDPKILQQQGIRPNEDNTTYTDLSYVPKNNLNTHHSPISNYSFMDKNNPHTKVLTMSNAPSWSNLMYGTESQVSQYVQNNNCNTRFPEITQIEPQDITRSSISRDSGFTSPVIPMSPSENYINNIQLWIAAHDYN